MKNYIWSVLFTVLVIFTGCACNKDKSRISLEGCWKKQIGQEVYKFNFEQQDSNSYYGTVTTYRDGEKIEQLQLKNISFKDLHLSMITNPKRNILYKGVLDTSEQVIKGELNYQNGSTYNFNLVRCQQLQTSPKVSHPQLAGFKYKLIEDLPPIVKSSNKEIRSDYKLIMESMVKTVVQVTDALGVINRRHGEVYPSYPERSRALLLAFLLDSLTEKISKKWDDLIKNRTSFNDKISAINTWNIQHMAYTQAHPVFKDMPGRDPWGTFGNSKQPVFKKLIPSEMEAMKLYTGKISGKCFTLVNLIISGFMQLGVHPDDIVVVMVKDGNARHAMALVKYEGEVLLVNLMMVGPLKNYIEKDFKPYKLLGIYNFNISQKVDLTLTRGDLMNILGSDENRLSKAFLNYYNLPKAGEMNLVTNLDTREVLYRKIFTGNESRSDYELSKYAYQSLLVRHPEYYLQASLSSSLPINLAKTLKSDEDVFNWIKTHIRTGSIFSDSDERIMTAGQVLVFQQGSLKDQAVLAWTLLKHLGIRSMIIVTETNTFLKTGEKYFDFDQKQWVEGVSGSILIRVEN